MTSRQLVLRGGRLSEATISSPRILGWPTAIICAIASIYMNQSPGQLMDPESPARCLGMGLPQVIRTDPLAVVEDLDPRDRVNFPKGGAIFPQVGAVLRVQ